MVGYQLAISDDQVESRLWWVAGGSSHTFAAESQDECARAVIGVTPQSSLFSLQKVQKTIISLPQNQFLAGPSQVGSHFFPAKWSTFCTPTEKGEPP